MAGILSGLFGQKPTSEKGLLTKDQYLATFADPMKEADPEPAVRKQVLSYAASVWKDVGLERGQLPRAAIALAHRSGDGRFEHVHVEYGVPDTFLIVVRHLPGGGLLGHILLDIGSEYAQVMLSSPVLGEDCPATPETIEGVVARLPGTRDPFVVAGSTGMTYMQAYCGDDGCDLEYQLVTTACHYRVDGLVSTDDVVRALKSYCFGKNEWLTMFPWVRVAW